MKIQLLSLISASFIFGCAGMERLHVVAAMAIVRNAFHTTYKGVLHDGRVIEVEVCIKQRETRNANPLEFHYSGKINKKGITRAQARAIMPKLHEAKQRAFVHPSIFQPGQVKRENSGV